MIIKDYLVNQIDGLNICKDTFYFDIETLGLSPKIHPIILICAAFYDSDETVLIRQYFCETLNEEKDPSLLWAVFATGHDANSLIVSLIFTLHLCAISTWTDSLKKVNTWFKILRHICVGKRLKEDPRFSFLMR